MTVYIIRSDCGRVKVGFTDDADPSVRVGGIRNMSPRPLELVCHFPGGIGDERKLHKFLDSERIHGEWFEPGPLLAHVVAYVKEFGTADGVEASLVEPTAWASYTARFGTPIAFESLRDLPARDARWTIAAEKLAAAGREPEASTAAGWFVEWEKCTRHASPIADLLTHRASKFYEEPAVEWELHGQMHYERGMAWTARALESAFSEEQAAAVWLKACIRDLTHGVRDQTIFTRVPCIEQLCTELHRASRVQWHHACTRVLPRAPFIPAHCVLRTEEFIRVCVDHLHALVGGSKLCFYWPVDFSISLKHRAGQVAA